MPYFTITPSTTPESLRSRYLELAVIHHPDKPTGSKEAFQQLQAEYEAAIKELLQRPEYGYITESENFIKFMTGIDDLVKNFGYDNLGNAIAEYVGKKMELIKIPPKYKILEEVLLPIVKMEVLSRVSNPKKLITDIEKQIRKPKK
jgi:curved DNA-binding protein CbpA